AERAALAVELLDDVGDELRWCEVLDLVDDEPLAADPPALSHVDPLHAGPKLVLSQADDVEVLRLVGHHLLALDHLPDGGQPVPPAVSPAGHLGGGGAPHPPPV